jgi:hypothetical protein
MESVGISALPHQSQGLGFDGFDNGVDDGKNGADQRVGFARPMSAVLNLNLVF